MQHSMKTPLLSANSTPNNSTTTSDTDDQSPPNSFRYIFQDFSSNMYSYNYKQLAILTGHVGSVSCLALSGEFILSASQGKDIIVWQQPDLKHFTKFGHGDGAVKAVITSGNRVFTAHQDSRIRVWKVSRSSENVFRMIDTLPTTKDYLAKFMKHSNYVQTRRHHKRLWIEHADTISCLTVSNGFIYSGSWDKTIKVWRMSDFKCLESIKAHDDAINALFSKQGLVYSSSADGKIKVWRKGSGSDSETHMLEATLEGRKDTSLNAVVVSEDGRFVYGGGSDGFIMVWLYKYWKKVNEKKVHRMSVLCLSVMGEFVLSGSADKSIGVWKVGVNGDLFKHVVITGHEGPVKCLQGSRMRTGSGFVLYTGSLDRTVRVWWVPESEYGCKDQIADESRIITRKMLIDNDF